MKHKPSRICIWILILVLALGGIAALCLTLFKKPLSSLWKKTAETPSETVNVYMKLPLPDLFVSIPEGYTEHSSQFYETYYVKDDASIIITEDNESPNTEARDYSTNALKQYMDVTKTLEMNGDSYLYANDLYVQLLEFTYTITEEDTPKSTMVSFMTDGTTVYIITCKCHAETYESHREEFLAAIRSQRVDKEWIGKSPEPTE